VDFAHTPDALAKVLQALRRHCNGRLLCVFSACGGCDQGKRPEMGQAVAANADVLIVTSDSPRYESRAAILRDLMDGVPRESDVVVDFDRASAIARAVREMRSDDVLVIAGKGHEKTIEVTGQILPFRDREVVLSALAGLSRR
jgi:UDP-N-acetylmuramyl tripeptide synthase